MKNRFHNQKKSILLALLSIAIIVNFAMYAYPTLQVNAALGESESQKTDNALGESAQLIPPTQQTTVYTLPDVIDITVGPVAITGDSEGLTVTQTDYSQVPAEVAVWTIPPGTPITFTGQIERSYLPTGAPGNISAAILVDVAHGTPVNIILDSTYLLFSESDEEDNYKSPILISSGKVNLHIVSQSVLYAGNYAAGLQKDTTDPADLLTISNNYGMGLDVLGGKYGAGIGGGDGKDATDIYITAVGINSTGGDNAAGLGGGNGGSARNIIFAPENDLTFNTFHGGTNAAAIGGGNGGNADRIFIKSGYNFLSTLLPGAVIGGGAGGVASNLSITGGYTQISGGNGLGSAEGLESTGTIYSGGIVQPHYGTFLEEENFLGRFPVRTYWYPQDGKNVEYIVYQNYTEIARQSSASGDSIFWLFPGPYEATATSEGLTLGSKSVLIEANEELAFYFDHELKDLYVQFGNTLPAHTEAGTLYEATIELENGTAPYAVELAKGTLPAGLTLNGTTEPFTLAGTPTQAGDYTFTLAAYDAADAAPDTYHTLAMQTFTIHVSPKFTQILEYPTTSPTYTGTPLQQIPLIGGTANTAGSFEWVDPQEIVATGAHLYYARFVPDDSNYETLEFAVLITADILVQTPQILTKPTTTAVKEGDLLSSSDLLGGSASVPGTFAWTVPDTVVLESGNYQAVFTPDDTTHYAPVLLDLFVEAVEPQEPEEPQEPTTPPDEGEDNGNAGNEGNNGTGSSRYSSSSGSVGTNRVDENRIPNYKRTLTTKEAVRAFQKAMADQKADTNEMTLVFTNYTHVDKNVLPQLVELEKKHGVAITIHFDNVVHKKTTSRLTMQPIYQEPTLVLQRTTDNKALATSLQKAWNGRKVAVLSLEQPKFAVPIGFAYLLPANMQQGDIEIYSYNRKTKKLVLLQDANPWIDSKGYVHFEASTGGDLVIVQK